MELNRKLFNGYDGFSFCQTMTKNEKGDNRITIRLTPDIKQKLDSFQRKKGFLQASAAARYLLVKGLEVEEQPTYLVKSQ